MVWELRIARGSDQSTIVPARPVDRLTPLKLPAGQVEPAGPGHDDVASQPIGRDDAIVDLAIAERVDQAVFTVTCEGHYTRRAGAVRRGRGLAEHAK